MDIDPSKENIRPLRGGRDQRQLGRALESDGGAGAGAAARALQLRRDEFEARVREYDGPDPLEPWFEYVQWVEQAFPKRGHEGQIDELVERCLALFEHDARYADDRRFLRLWIRYIDASDSPLELYQMLHDRGVGAKRAELYRAWACYCEQAADYPKAEQVYTLGLRCGAEPRDELRRAHAAFQIWFAQRLLHDDSPTKRKAANALAETRSALTSLRAVKRRNVDEGGASTSSATSNSKQAVAVLDENPSPGPSSLLRRTTPRAGAPPSLLRAIDRTENRIEAGAWTERSEKPRHLRPNADLPFAIYEDCDAKPPFDEIPVCVPDPPDPSRVPCYDKSQVYVETDGRLVEYSPEEIRARRYLPSEPKPDAVVLLDEYDIEKVIAQSNSLLNSDGQAYLGEDEAARPDVVADFNNSIMANLLGNSATADAKEELNLFGDEDSVRVIRRTEPVKFDIREDHSLTMASVRAKCVDASEANQTLCAKENERLQNAYETPCGPSNMNRIDFDVSSTGVFSFNVHSASTPCADNFKKPQFTSAVKKFNIDESVPLTLQTPTGNYVKVSESDTNKPPVEGLYPIMETTQEYRSGSSSSGSNFVSKNMLYEYTPKERTVALNDKHPVQVNYQRAYEVTDVREQTPKFSNQQTSVDYGIKENVQSPQMHSNNAHYALDHSYHKMSYYNPQKSQNNGNGFQSHVPYETVDNNYNGYRGYPVDYDSNQAMYHQQYQNPQQGDILQSYQSPRQSYATYSGNSQNGYMNVQNHHQYSSPNQDYAAYHHQNAYANAELQNRRAYQTMQYQTTANPTNQTMQYQQPYQQRPQTYVGNEHLQSYQSPQQYSNQYYTYDVPKTPVAYEYVNNNVREYAQYNQQPSTHSISKQNTPILNNSAQYQSSTSKLRSVRHEVPNSSRSNVYRYNQTNHVDVPKFNSSPNISQKMHRNLYVSSPETARHSVETDRDESNFVMYKEADNKDHSKRQLDFESRVELLSEDSRDSVGKDRTPSVRSRQSTKLIHTGSTIQMDVDSENSMDYHTLTFKTNCSDSLVATEDIPRPADIPFPETIDPFNADLCNSLLQYVKFPNKNHCKSYYELKSVPKLHQGTIVTFDHVKFSVEKQLGKGTFGNVFRAFDNYNAEAVALKFQKPAHPWEYYICQEIKARISDPYILPGYMDIRSGYFGENASLFVSELSVYGSLLDVANRIRTATTKCINEFIVMLLASEMLSIVHHLHKAKIIHADIKPDNFLVMKIPQTESRAPSLQLIDFGCAIDMTLFPEGTAFKKLISTEGFTCTEMRDRRPWTYQTDLFCLAGTVYVVLMGNYMQTVNRGGVWAVQNKWPRYMKSAIWDQVFTPLLNVKDCDSIPDLLEIKDKLDEFLRYEETTLSNQLRKFEHVLKRK